MEGSAVSVIVVSRHRPALLLRCLAGLEQLDHRAFEIVVVADPDGIAFIDAAGFGQRVKLIAFDEPNISVARNRGLAVAAGEVVAFIDDDAVPEPTWLSHLTAPFHDADVSAAGGYVIGRNGISFQNRGRRVDARGRHRPIAIGADAPVVLRAVPGDAVKTEGTNCAFRVEVLRRIGGFDPAFRFYLDETDVNLRLAAQGGATAIVPLAHVHHGFAASGRRRSDRAPTTLSDIGASLAVFLRRHAPSELEAGLADMRAEQRARLLRFMVAGLCDPRDVGRLMDSLEEGFAEGRGREIGELRPLPAPDAAFLRFRGRTTFEGMEVVSGRPWQAARLRRAAAERVSAGRRVSLYLFGFTARYHSVRFRPDGVWEQSGGQFGRSVRSAPLIGWSTLKGRVRREMARVRAVRETAI